MARVIFLGTASALPSATQDNSSLLFESNGYYLMIDCSGTPYRKLLHLGVDTKKLQHIVMTHHHVDHCYALPSLIECLWIEGREEPLHIYALRSAIAVIEPLLDLFDLRHRMINYFPIEIHPIDGREDEFVFENENFAVRTTPTLHAVPSVATKIIFPKGTSFVYSSDTAPCRTLVDFAKGSDNFVMECTFCDDDDALAELTRHIHSSEWGDLASAVGAQHTFMIHHSDVTTCSYSRVLDEIGKGSGFPSPKVILPRDLDQFTLE
jgi:ribonuclease Z